MGGRALKCESIRVDLPTYLTVCKQLLADLNNCLPSVKFLIPKHLPTKQDFGDIDILYSFDERITPNEIKLNIKGNVYTPKYSFVNTDVLSFEYPLDNGKFLQIDLIKVPEESLFFAYNYFSYGDTGNILGRVYHKTGFKLSSEGLKYHYVSKYKSVDIMLTTDWETALSFVGYVDYYSHDFYDTKSCLMYAFSSPFTNKEMFNIEDGNHANRIRNVKRPMFMYMQQYINEHDNITANFDWSNKELLQWKFFVEAQHKFPQFKEAYDNLVLDDKLEQEYRNKFNGTVVSELTGYKEKELNKFLSDFSRDYIINKTQWRTDVLNMTEKELQILIKQYNKLRIT